MLRPTLSVLAGLVLAVPTLQAQTSTTKDFGLIAGPVTLELSTSNPAHVPFENQFFFTIAEATPLSFSAQLATGGRGSSSNDLDAQLLKDGVLLADGWDRTEPPRPGVPEGPFRRVDFAPVWLTAGQYTLSVTGTVVGRWPDLPYGDYSGSAGFSLAAPVPEPSQALMLALGAGGVALWLRRRPLRGRAASPHRA